ncbi:NAD(P)H-binding protein [Nocardioides panacisoli]|uniref:NAD(P)-dependent oxidoreductase n=1 Tax=Nocardioides panacisoli TaxID=627624 RepID=UPI001C62AB51|nr:NAD(P)H-binding protein [Nocardioides panacisoli]QYJ03545.1 NAD(P)H-binding protein [Nocardioides panacisoli]
MKILVLGGTGAAGSRIAREARDRGHQVGVASRRGADTTMDLTGMTALALDASISTRLLCVTRAHDAVVLSVRSQTTRPEGIVAVTQRVATAARRSGRRLVVVGGAGPLQVPGTTTLAIDDPRYVPSAALPAASASIRQLSALREVGGEWVYFAPPARFKPGPRRGTYATADGDLVVDSDGASSISMEDFAIALVDELEAPGPSQRVVAVGQR